MSLITVKQTCPVCSGHGATDHRWGGFWKEFAPQQKTLAYLQDDHQVQAWFYSRGLSVPETISGPCTVCGGSGEVTGQISKDDYNVLQQEGIASCGNLSFSFPAWFTS